MTAGRVIQPGLAETLQQVHDSERSPPLYYVLAWFWTKPFGLGEVGLRSFSALIGVAAIPVAYLAGRELSGRARAGLIAAALVTVSPLLVWYSQEARSYELMVLLVGLALWLTARALADPSGKNLAWWASASALAVATHYFAAFLIAPMALWLLVGNRAQARRAAAYAVAALAVPVAALALFAAAQQGDDRRDGFTDRSVTTRAAELVVKSAAGQEPDPGAGTARIDLVQATATLGSLAVLGLAGFLWWGRSSARERRGGWVALTVVIAAVGLPLALAFGTFDFFRARNALGALMPLLVFAAIGLGAERSGRLGVVGRIAALSIGLGVNAAIVLAAEMQRPDWRAVADAIGGASQERLLVVPRNGDDPLALYLGADKLGPAASRGREFRLDEVVAVRLSPGKAPAGFRLAGRKRVAGLAFVERYRAARPRPVSGPAVADAGNPDERWAVLVQRSRSKLR